MKVEITGMMLKRLPAGEVCDEIDTMLAVKVNGCWATWATCSREQGILHMREPAFWERVERYYQTNADYVARRLDKLAAQQEVSA